DDRLIVARGGAGAGDDADVRQRDDLRVDGDEVLDRVGVLLRKGRPEGLRYGDDDESTHRHPHRNTSAAMAPRSSFPCPLAIASSIRFAMPGRDRKSTRLNSSHRTISYAVFCLKKKKPTSVSNRTGLPKILIS